MALSQLTSHLRAWLGGPVVARRLPRSRRLGPSGPRGGLWGLEHGGVLQDGDAPAGAGVSGI